jgi:hypothetical protein
MQAQDKSELKESVLAFLLAPQNQNSDSGYYGYVQSLIGMMLIFWCIKGSSTTGNDPNQPV